MRFDICHRLEVHQDRDGEYYAEVYDHSRLTRVHTTENYPTSDEAADAAREWDRIADLADTGDQR